MIFFDNKLIVGANQKSSSHFHCLKCDYYCTDTNKVVAHRRLVHLLLEKFELIMLNYALSQKVIFSMISSKPIINHYDLYQANNG